MLSKQEEQAERKEVLENDKRLREQGSTFLDHQHDEAGGRFKEVGASNVIGSTEMIAGAYPAASSAHQTELPPEKPLGYDINALEPLEPSVTHGSAAQSESAPLPTPGDVERTTEPLLSSRRNYRRTT
jgi:hypothetical protein